MQSTNNPLSERFRAQSAELLRLADAIDMYTKAERVHSNAREAAVFTAAHSLVDAMPPKEDYSDLMPNPPDDPAAWRGAVLRRFRNAAGPA